MSSAKQAIYDRAAFEVNQIMSKWLYQPIDQKTMTGICCELFNFYKINSPKRNKIFIEFVFTQLQRFEITRAALSKNDINDIRWMFQCELNNFGIEDGKAILFIHFPDDTILFWRYTSCLELEDKNSRLPHYNIVDRDFFNKIILEAQSEQKLPVVSPDKTPEQTDIDPEYQSIKKKAEDIFAKASTGYHFVDNFRFCLPKEDGNWTEQYAEARRKGCCGYFDEKINGIWIGFNYDH